MLFRRRRWHRVLFLVLLVVPSAFALYGWLQRWGLLGGGR